MPKVLDQTVLVAPFNDLETTGRIIAEHADELAAVIIEPLQRSIVPSRASCRACARSPAITASR